MKPSWLITGLLISLIVHGLLFLSVENFEQSKEAESTFVDLSKVILSTENQKTNLQEQKQQQSKNQLPSTQENRGPLKQISQDASSTQEESISKPQEVQKAQYENVVRAWLNRQKHYPRQALFQKIEGSLTLKLSLNRQGKVISHQIIQPSQSNLLNDEAHQMVQRAGTFPSAPDFLEGENFDFTIPVRFEIMK